LKRSPIASHSFNQGDDFAAFFQTDKTHPRYEQKRKT
jgi:hypothetical protein